MIKEDISNPKWAEFNKEWYSKRYSSVLPMIDDIYGGDIYAYYQKKGQKIGHSPNPFFDEKWYLLTYPDVVKAIQNKEFQSGFDHYCQVGFKDYSPHWLFSEEFYRTKYAQITDGFSGYKNGYHHYLTYGDRSLYSGSLFFNPILYLLQQDKQDQLREYGAYQSFLENLPVIKNVIRTSWFFDEEWYLETYPEIKTLIKRQTFLSGLHHYLANERPTSFSPLSDFSEKFYDEKYTDVASSVGIGPSIKLRNGYTHFILYGFPEGRKPNETLDLQNYKNLPEVEKILSYNIFYNAFEYWVAKKQEGLLHKYQDLFEHYHNIKITLNNFVLPEGSPELTQKVKAPDVNIPDAAELKNINVDEVSKNISKPIQEANHVTTQTIEENNDDTDEDFTSLIVAEDPSLFQIETPKEKIEFIDFPKTIDNREEKEFNSNSVIKETQKQSGRINSDKALWKAFDEEWYIHKYSAAMAQMKALELDSIEEYYLSFGCYEGHSPNPYFDEIWYLRTYPDVKELIEKHYFISGFDHYCQKGFLTHSPHWLFSETYYKQVNAHLTNDVLQNSGFVNGYDHYLRVGDKEGLSGSIFFDPIFFVGQYSNPISFDLGVYSHYLKYIDTVDVKVKTSWYFDPVWYLEQYLDIDKAIKDKNYLNSLHHYLTNDTPFKFSPSLWFDENFYDTEYRTILQKKENAQRYRNGYDHFINEGIELLHQPSLSVDLGAYSLKSDVQRDIDNGLYPNIYVHWLANHYDVQHIELLDAYEDEGYLNVNDILGENKNYEGALWAQVDEEWYLATYTDIKEKMDICGIDSVHEYYEQVGAFLGHSPNAYFDEQWYVNQHNTVQRLIKRGVFKTGFEHYCKKGFKKYQPHWLFSPEYYLRQNPQFAYEISYSTDYINEYDHYLKKGDGLRKSGSIFFDPLVYERHCYESGHVEKSFFPFRNYLLNTEKADRKATISLYFDTGWYLSRYPEVLTQIKEGDISSALQHYLTNSTPTLYDPLPWFSEQFYMEANPDLSGAIIENGKGAFRNGYEHFLLHGCLECRRPHSDVDLKEYFLSGHIRDDIENGLYRDVFAHWVFDKRLEAWLNNLPEDSHYRLSDKIVESRDYFRKKARFILPTVAHQKLDFSYQGKPDISVIILVKNQLPVTLTALASLRANFSGKIQLLIGDNYSTDDTRFIQNSLIGARITRFAYNFGYGRACNYLIEQAQAPITVFLNNDIYLYPGAIQILCQHLMSKADIGAVGGKIIHPDGNLQEAGSIIWRDGTTTGYLRGQDPSVAEANFVRDVDYCSTAMMAIRTSLLQQLKGFSPVYYPAYFEDTDLCVRIIKAGYRVVYHPDAVIEHMEYASSDPIVSSGLIRRNHRQFVKEHTDFLRFQHPRHSDNIVIARQRVSNAKRILFIEDRVPLRRLGSGYIRSNDIIHQMAKLGYNVTVYPVNNYYPHLYQIYSDMPEAVEVMFDKTIDNIRDFFFERAGYYDAIWIGRTHNLHRVLPMMGEANRYLPQDCLVLDTEVIAAPRTKMRNEILGLPIDTDETLEDALEIELSCARHCQTMITVNKLDAEYANQAGFNHVSILGHMMPVRATPKSWEQRKGLLFIGALHDDLSPNFDSLQWFLDAVLPILIKKMGDQLSLTIAGYVHPSVDMSLLAKYPQVDLLGPVEDLTYLYNDHRVYIAPTRFAGGIPYKLHEAASYGVPIVATELLVKQLGWDDDKDILAASIDNPEFFASQIIRLYQEEELWDKVRNSALSRIDTECNEHRFRENLQQILTNVISHK